MKKIRRSVVLPAILLLYLLIMAYVGFPHFEAGQYLFYFGIIGGSLLVILLLYFVLRKREKMRQFGEDSSRYGTYADDKKESKKNEDTPSKNKEEQ
jgi:Na+-driven multidrug efflux pump